MGGTAVFGEIKFVQWPRGADADCGCTFTAEQCLLYLIIYSKGLSDSIQN